METNTIGICGTGRMGTAIAQRLLDAGRTLHVWNRNAKKTHPLEKLGAHVAKTPAELALHCDIVLCMLFDEEAVDVVYRGPGGLLSSPRKENLFIEMSTIGVDAARALETDTRSAGAALLECPVGGSVGPAREGKLLGLVGGDLQDLERARPVLDTLCRRIEHSGPVGAGAQLKLAVNLPLLVYWAALGEALDIAADLDIPAERLADLMADTSGAAVVLPKRLKALTGLLGEAKHPATSFDIRSAAKDLSIMLETAGSNHAAAPVTAAAHQTFRAAMRQGLSDADAMTVAGLGYLRRRSPKY